MTNIRSLTYDFALKQFDVRKLPLQLNDLFRIAKKYEWQILKYSEAKQIIEALKSEGIDLTNYIEKVDGFAISYKGEVLILYKNGLSTHRTIYVICHEIGHIVLNHISSGVVLGISDNKFETSLQEEEADEFALEMMAPLPILTQYKIESQTDLSKLGYLPADKVQKQYEKLLIARDDAYIAKNENEIQLCKHYGDTIKFKHKEMRKAALKKKSASIIITAALAAVLVSGTGIGFWMANHDGGPTDNTAPVQSAAPSPAQTEAPTTQPTIESTPTATPVPETTQKLVYLTKSGTKYHTVDCPYINQKDTFTMSIEKVKENDYQACKFCRPDEN